jgi:hypothetical protein
VPVLVDPAVPTRKNGFSPRSRSSAISASAAARSIRRSSSTGTTRTCAEVNPAIRAAFATQ